MNEELRQGQRALQEGKEAVEREAEGLGLVGLDGGRWTRLFLDPSAQFVRQVLWFPINFYSGSSIPSVFGILRGPGGVCLTRNDVPR